MHTILIGGEERPFHYTVGVLKKIIASTGEENPENVPFSKLKLSPDNLSLDSLTTIIHAALNAGAKRDGGEILKKEVVETWVDDMTLDELMTTFNKMTGEGEEEAPEETDTEKN